MAVRELQRPGVNLGAPPAPPNRCERPPPGCGGAGAKQPLAGLVRAPRGGGRRRLENTTSTSAGSRGRNTSRSHPSSGSIASKVSTRSTVRRPVASEATASSGSRTPSSHTARLRSRPESVDAPHVQRAARCSIPADRLELAQQRGLAHAARSEDAQHEKRKLRGKESRVEKSLPRCDRQRRGGLCPGVFVKLADTSLIVRRRRNSALRTSRSVRNIPRLRVTTAPLRGQYRWM